MVIKNATFYIMPESHEIGNIPRIDIHNINNYTFYNWTNITWSNQICGGIFNTLQPPCNNTALSGNDIDTDNIYYSYAVTDAVKKAFTYNYKLTNLVLMIDDELPATYYPKAQFYSWSNSGAPHSYLEVCGNYTITTTIPIGGTTIPGIHNLSEYYDAITRGILPEGSSFTGNRIDFGKYLIGIFLVIAFTAGAIYVADAQAGLFVGMVITFILSLITMLPIQIAYIMIIVAVIIIGNAIREQI